MLKKVCSVLLSSILAFGVSTKKSDAGFLSGVFKYIGACGFVGTAIFSNCIVLGSKINDAKILCIKDNKVKKHKLKHINRYGFSSFRTMAGYAMPFYGFFAALYTIGKLDEICNTIMYSSNSNSNSNSNDKNIAKSRSYSSEEFPLLGKYKEKTEDKK